MYATHPKRPWARVWNATQPGRLKDVVKAKPHLTREQRQALGQLHLWAGNQAADAAAKARAELALPSRAVCDDIDAAEAARLSVMRGVAKLLAAYPSAACLVDPDMRKAANKLARSQLV